MTTAKMHRIPRSVAATLLFALSTTGAFAQDRPTVQPDEYGKFESLSSPAFSPDAAWIAYPISRVDGSFELRLRATSDATTEQAFENGQRPEFSEDGRWLAWTVGVPANEAARMREAGEPVRTGLALLEMGADDERVFEAVASRAFDSTGRYLAILGHAPEEPRGKGADLRVMDLQAGTTMTFGNVAEYAWTDMGSRLAVIVATGADEGNGVQLYDAASGVVAPLDSSSSAYRGLSWREDAADLAVYRSAGMASDPGDGYDVLAWRGLDGGMISATVLAASADALPAGTEVVRHRGIEWSEDGSRLAIGLRPTETADGDAAEANEMEDAAAEEGAESEEEESEPDDSAPTEEPELPGVQIWHTSDVRLYPAQKVSEGRDARRTLLSVWHLDSGAVAQIGSDLMESASLAGDWSYGFERVAAPYPWGAMFGRPYFDLWKIDGSTGERERIAEQVRYAYVSPDGGYAVTFDGDDYWSYRTSDGNRTNLTAGIDVDFQNVDSDTPTDLLPPHGVGGWLEEDAAILVYDQFDIWRLAPDGGSAALLTDGRADSTIFRMTRVDPTAGFFNADPFDPTGVLFMSLRNEDTEQRGYARLDVGSDSATRLMLEDQLISSLRQIGDSDRFAYSIQARDDSPDYFLGDAGLVGATQVTETNPFLGDYAWTRSELVDFVSEGGRDLQAALLYPADYDPEREYPMIVYTYEILAPQIHGFQVPSERNYYNFTAWTQQGYFVLLPDIVYTWREPGQSAIESVRAAVTSVVARGLVDGDRVGLIGHSWGGYQATYLPTRIDTFAASVAGAPLTDFVSFMGQLHWNPGIAELSHWETGQGRMEVPYWEDPEAHHRSSPIHKVHEMNTPLLMAFGDADGVVDWDQGTEFYNFARRAGKQMVLLVYEGEDHGFRNEANQKDYHRRILEWFGHYLKGDPAPAWITEGVAIDDLDDEKKRVATGEPEQH